MVRRACRHPLIPAPSRALPNPQIRTTVALPHGTGKTVRIAVLAEGAAADEALAAGADIVGMADLIADISAGASRGWQPRPAQLFPALIRGDRACSGLDVPPTASPPQGGGGWGWGGVSRP
eukprot:scaffold25620_cov99-Isochrysis_galbana.AAC.1